MAAAAKNNAEALEREIKGCTICAPHLPHAPRPVLHLSDHARLVVAGQAPGRRVHETGLPFNDPSGDRLRDWMGVDRDTFYDRRKIAIVPMGFCYPGTAPGKGDLPPRPECRATWHDLVFETLPRAHCVLVIGRYAIDYHLGERAFPSVTETVAHFRDYLPRYLPLPHPSPRNTLWLRRNDWFEVEVIPKLREIVAHYVNER